MNKKLKTGPSSSGKTLVCGTGEGGSNPSGPLSTAGELAPPSPTGPSGPATYFIIAPPPENKMPGLPTCWTIYLVNSNCWVPYVYIRKPKNVDQEKFDKFMKNLKFYGPQSGEGF